MTNYNDGKIHGWNGGECPVHPEAVVKFWTNSGGIDPVKAKCLRWKHTDEGLGDIIAFQVVKAYVEPKVIWVNEYRTTKSGWDSEADAKKYAIDATRVAVKYVEARDD